MCIDRGYAEASDKGDIALPPQRYVGSAHWPKEPVGTSPWAV